ncbi:MAG: hypothetical protein IJM30_13160 [Thermoguttaceae bacterium]|nr:hypothetical protein [Thermoguttaceae bacterium]
MKTYIKITTLALAFLAIAGSCFGQSAPQKGDVASLVNLTKNFSKLINSPRTTDEETEPAEAPESADAIRLPVPQDVDVVLRAPSLNALDRAAAKFFLQTGDSEFGVLGALKLTDYRKALAAINPDAEVAVMLFCESAPPKFAVVLPVPEKRFQAFVEGLERTAPPDERNLTIGTDGRTANVAMKIADSFVVVARQIDPNYVVLAQASDATILNSFDKSALGATPNGFDQGLNAPCLSLEATPDGLARLTDPERPFWRELARLLSDREEELGGIQVAANLEEIREYVRRNLLAVRVDASIDDYGIYLSTRSSARPGSTGEKRIASYSNLQPLNGNADRFFVVLPDVEAPLSGQTEISPVVAAALPKPFDRARFIEYSLNLPLERELAGESWQFYLEVDDADAFVREMIIPKAREIGGYIGGGQLEEVGGRLFGGIAERRRAQGRPVLAGTPEAAAARGATLGGLIGGAIGADAAEQMAMKQYKFDDFTMYVSDLETYARQKALMAAEARGEAPPPDSPLLFDRDRPLLSALDAALANSQSGEPLQLALLRSANQRAEAVDNSPLLARKSAIVVLDRNHLLIGLGNESLLRYAVNNWKSLTRPSIRYMSIKTDPSGIVNLQKLIEQIANSENSSLESAIRVDLARSLAFCNFAARRYLGASGVALPVLPDGTPGALVVTTIDDGTERVHIVAPNLLIERAFKAFANGSTPLRLIIKGASAEADDASEEGSLDDAFDE